MKRTERLAWLLRVGVLVSVTVLVAAVSSAGPVHAAAPRVIVVEGDLLDTPIILSDWSENLELVGAIESTKDNGPSQTADPARPRLDVLYYWLNDVPANLSVANLGSPEGRIGYWPATPSGPALIAGYPVSPTALTILERHGVPTSVDEPANSSGESEGISTPAILAATACVILLVVGLGLAYRRRRGGAFGA